MGRRSSWSRTSTGPTRRRSTSSDSSLAASRRSAPCSPSAIARRSSTARHPVRLMVGELASAVSLRRVPLSPLSPDAVARLAEPYGIDPLAAAPDDRRERVLRDGGAGVRRNGDPGHGSRRRPRPHRTALAGRAGRARRCRDRAAARGDLARRDALRPARRAARRVHHLRRARLGGRVRLVPARARPTRRRGVDPTGPRAPAASRRARRAPRARAGGSRAGAPRAPRGGGR